jgi:hypothetical protein
LTFAQHQRNDFGEALQPSAGYDSIW